MTTIPRISRERLLILLTATCLGLLLLDRFLLTPAISAWQATSDEIHRLETSIAQGEALVDQEAGMARWRADMQTRYLSATPSDAERDLVQSLDTWSRESGLRLTGLRPNWKTHDDGTAYLELQLGGSGTPQSVANFLYRLETAPRALIVEQSELKPGRVAASELGLDLRLVALCNPVAAVAKTSRSGAPASPASGSASVPVPTTSEVTP